MNENLLVSYSLLAALSENQSDLYKTVYLPLFRRAISLYASSGKTAGSDLDIQNLVKEEFGIEVPQIIVQKLIKAVSNDLSKREKDLSKFTIFQDGKSFQFETFTFEKIEELYLQEKQNASMLQKAFEEFAKNETEEEVASFSCFINKNKQRLSSFFSGEVNSVDNVEVDASFMLHVDFLNEIENNYKDLYKAAENIFLGSIIASYLESGLDLEAKIENGITYYLDTQIVLEALDLQQEEDTKPTIELIKLIKATGGVVKILGITVSEIYSIIELAIKNYDKENPTTTINEACVRNKKNKAWLINANGRLENFLEEALDVKIEIIPERKINEYKKSDDIQLLKGRRKRKHTAVHDVIAYLYVRDKRGDNTRIFQKAKSWFVTANKNLFDFNLDRKINGFVNETIMPTELTSLLFLKNPLKLSGTVSGIGLNELIAQTISEEYASKDLINEFDAAIKSSIKINQEDYQILLSSIATHSTKRIENLIDESLNENKEKFNKEIHKIIERGRKKKVVDRKEREKSQAEKTAIINEKDKIEQEKEDLAKNLEHLNSLLRLSHIKIEQEQDAKKAIEEKGQKLKITLILVLFLIVSISWWIITSLIEIPYTNILSKTLIQVFFAFFTLVFINGKHRPQWIMGCIASLIAIITTICNSALK